MGSGNLYTVGHSTHSLADFLRLLELHEIESLADVRMFPSSRRFPHFAREALAGSLPGAGISYVHLKDLGGRRKARPASPLLGGSSPNRGWRVGGFRGYADYMQTEPFEAALEELMRLGRAAPTAIMCAEALWWRCHRRLIADALVVRGWEVRHIAPDGSAGRHELTSFAKISDGRVSYPPAQGELTEP